TQDAWLNPDAIARRLTFATALANDRLSLNSPPVNKNESGWMLPQTITPPTNPPLVRGGTGERQLLRGETKKVEPIDSLQLANTLGNNFSAKTQSAIASSPPNLRAALILGSPEFMHK
ncbi:MAG: DUF1800 domain-containing protein, partial [Microcoleus sp.]